MFPLNHLVSKWTTQEQKKRNKKSTKLNLSNGPISLFFLVHYGFLLLASLVWYSLVKPSVHHFFGETQFVHQILFTKKKKKVQKSIFRRFKTNSCIQEAQPTRSSSWDTFPNHRFCTTKLNRFHFETISNQS